MTLRSLRTAAVIVAILVVSVDASSSVVSWADEALCFVLNKVTGLLSKTPITIPAQNGQDGGCGLRWNIDAVPISLSTLKFTGCAWIKDTSGVGASVNLEGIQVSNVHGYATDYDHFAWPVNCAHIGDAHFTFGCEAAASLKLVLPTKAGAKCESDVALPQFHDEISITDGGVEGAIKQKIMNALHGKIQGQMQQQIGSQTTDKICSFVTGCEAGVHQCGQAAEQTFKTCTDIKKFNATQCEAQARQTLTQTCADAAKKCIPTLDAALNSTIVI